MSAKGRLPCLSPAVRINVRSQHRLSTNSEAYLDRVRFLLTPGLLLIR